MWAGRGRERDPRSLFRKETDEEVRHMQTRAYEDLRHTLTLMHVGPSSRILVMCRYDVEV